MQKWLENVVIVRCQKYWSPDIIFNLHFFLYLGNRDYHLFF